MWPFLSMHPAFVVFDWSHIECVFTLHTISPDNPSSWKIKSNCLDILPLIVICKNDDKKFENLPKFGSSLCSIKTLVIFIQERKIIPLTILKNFVGIFLNDLTLLTKSILVLVSSGSIITET